MNRMTRRLGWMLVGMLLMSCHQDRPPCLVPQDVWLRIGCYSVDMGQEGRVESDTFLIHPLFGYLDSAAAFLLEPRTQRFSLVLSPHEDHTAIWIVTDSLRIHDPGYRDTIRFRYDRKLHFISNACGYTYYYELQDIEYSRHQLDSVVIMDAQVTDNVNTEHVKIYY